MKSKTNISIGLLSFPSSKTGVTPLSNLVDILTSISEVNLVSGNESCRKFKNDPRLNLHCTNHHSSDNAIKRIFNYIHLQFKMAWDVLKLSKKVDFWIFFIGGDTLILPMLMAKITNKKVILLFAGSSIQTMIHRSDKFAKMARWLSRFNCRLSNKIILYFESLIEEWGLEDYQEKIWIQSRHFIDFNTFKSEKEYNEREYIGYVGRLSEEKGVMNFVESLPLLDNDLKFLICGEGPLKSQINQFLENNDLKNRVNVTGWVNHEELPDYLNEMKLLVVPSFTEGFPNVILESMACGTPVAATSAGAIKEILNDSENGFLIAESNPSSISTTIKRALEYPEMNEIIKNGQKTVSNFEYSQILGQWDQLMHKFYQEP